MRYVKSFSIFKQKLQTENYSTGFKTFLLSQNRKKLHVLGFIKILQCKAKLLIQYTHILITVLTPCGTVQV